MIRLGIEGNRSAVMQRVRSLNAAVLISASSLWDAKRKTFRETWRHYAGLDLALDSGGFTAMRLFGGYRFTPDQYVALAARMRPTWWAQMDFCCEPEIASNAAAVARRKDQTAEYLRECRRLAGIASTQMPLIVLQGWKPADYCRGPAFDDPAFEWPSLVGVGSVCRRHLQGSDGLLSVIREIDRVLPPHVKLHLFGVKGAALARLASHPRFASMDSMAWNRAARWHAVHSHIPCDGQLRADFRERWHKQQLRHTTQPQLALF